MLFFPGNGDGGSDGGGGGLCVVLDECIDRDVYFRVFDYFFFVVVVRVPQSILIMRTRASARANERMKEKW